MKKSDRVVWGEISYISCCLSFRDETRRQSSLEMQMVNSHCQTSQVLC